MTEEKSTAEIMLARLYRDGLINVMHMEDKNKYMVQFSQFPHMVKIIDGVGNFHEMTVEELIKLNNQGVLIYCEDPQLGNLVDLVHQQVCQDLSNGTHDVTLRSVRPEVNIVVKHSHNYLFCDPQTAELRCGYCIERTHTDASFIMEGTKFTGWCSGQNNNIKHFLNNELKDLIIKDLGCSSVAKRLRKFIITYDGPVGKSNSHSVIKSYNDVIVKYLKVRENDIHIYFKQLKDNIQGNVVYRATLTDYLKAIAQDESANQEDPLDEMLKAETTSKYKLRQQELAKAHKSIETIINQCCDDCDLDKQEFMSKYFNDWYK